MRNRTRKKISEKRRKYVIESRIKLPHSSFCVLNVIFPPRFAHLLTPCTCRLWQNVNFISKVACWKILRPKGLLFKITLFNNTFGNFPEVQTIANFWMYQISNFGFTMWLDRNLNFCTWVMKWYTYPINYHQ